MSVWAYVDSSVIVAALFGEDLGPYKKILKKSSRPQLFSSYLLEAEVLSAARREGAEIASAALWLGAIGFLRTTSLQAELKKVFELGYIRGADAFHLATAIWVRDKHQGLRFLTLDERQRQFAESLSFPTEI